VAKNLLRDLVRRRVPQILGVYLGASWVVIEFVGMLVDHYLLPPHLIDLSIVLLASLVPTVVLLAYFHGAPGRDGWTRAEKYFISTNLLVSAALLAVLLAGKDLGARTSDGADRVRPPGPDPSESSSRTAIVPFRVAGADPELGYLREGMVDLLAAKLAGEDGLLAAIDAGTMVGAWRGAVSDERVDLPRAEAVELARDLGAGRLIVGSVVGTPENLVLHASVVDVRTGEAREGGSADGTEVALLDLVDRLVGQLLSRSAGEEEHRLAHLTSTSLPALHAFLAGRAAHRRGDYEEALRRYGRALDLDSTFALAGLGITQISGWVGGSGPVGRRGSAVASRYRERLSVRDRVGLEGRIGPRDPDRTLTVTLRLEELEHALRRYPDHPMLWHKRGDLLLHWGGALGFAAWEERARESFERAIDLDSDYSEPVHHLSDVLRMQGDTAALRGLVTRRLARTPSGPIADYLRWQAHHVLGEGSRFGEPELESMETDATLRWIGIVAQDAGFAISDGAKAVQLRLKRPGTADAQLERRLGAFSYALNGGRPAEALAILESLPDVFPSPRYRHLDLRLALLTGMYADGDRPTAERAAEALGQVQADGANSELDECVLAQWRLYAETHGLRVRSGAEPTALAALAEDRPSAAEWVFCKAVLDAQFSVQTDAASWRAAVGRLDTLLATGRYLGLVDRGDIEYAHLALARLQEAAGDSAAALTALRRRSYYLGWQPYLATMLRNEGRLAAALGDTAGAIRAYEHYLAFRGAPEQSLRSELERVRAELARLRR